MKDEMDGAGGKAGIISNAEVRELRTERARGSADQHNGGDPGYGRGEIPAFALVRRLTAEAFRNESVMDVTFGMPHAGSKRTTRGGRMQGTRIPKIVS